MQLEWPEHSERLVRGLVDLHIANKFHDVTLSAEGKQIKAHRVVLAAASSYFRDLLQEEHEDRFPIIFLKDVKYRDLEFLLRYIYTGKTEVASTDMASYLSLAETLGVTGFKGSNAINNNKKSLENITNSLLMKSKSKSKIGDKENTSPFVKWSASEPTASTLDTDEAVSAVKRRKIHSLEADLDFSLTTSLIATPPSPFRTPTAANIITTTPSIGSPRKQHPVHLSCPVPSSSSNSSPIYANTRQSPIYMNTSAFVSKNSPRTPSNATTPKMPHGSMVNNFSFDSTVAMINTDQLAAKGASLLQHLAYWMMEEQKSKERVSKGDQSPPPPPPNSTSSGSEGNGNSEAVPSTSGSATAPAALTRRRTGGGGSECDRPDSGFDSKDEEEVKSMQQHQVSATISEEVAGTLTPGVRTASSSSGDTSPDVTVEMSRQAPIRQPIFRKRRLHHLN